MEAGAPIHWVSDLSGNGTIAGGVPLLVPFRFEDFPSPDEQQQEDEGQPAGERPSEEMAETIKDKIAFIAQMMALLEMFSAGRAIVSNCRGA